MLHTQFTKNVAGAVSVLLFVGLTLSNVNAKPGHRGAPPEAIEACVDKVEGDACSFISPRDDEIEGSCIVPPRSEAALACAPAGGPPKQRPPRQPKEE